MVIHQQGIIVYANPATALLAGIASPDVLVGQPVISFVHPESLELAAERIRAVQARDSAEAPYVEERFVRPDGKVLDVEVTALGISFRGEPAVQVIIRDVTERRRAEAERQRLLEEQRVLAAESERRALELQTILDNMIDAVLVCDASGTITHRNAAAERLVSGELATAGRHPLTVTTLPLRRLDGTAMPPEERPLVRALAGEVVDKTTMRAARTPGGEECYLRVSASPIRSKAGIIVGAVAVGRDVTALVELDLLKDQFIQVAAHELKTPITVVKGFAQGALASPQELTGSLRRKLEAIDRGADRITRIVNDLLDVSQLQLRRLTLVIAPVDLCAVVREALRGLALTTTRHLLTLVRADPVKVEADADRLGQVLTNLLGNAIKYSPDGGSIELGVEASGDEAKVWVRDYGVGIPEARQGRIFERFYRAHQGSAHDFGGMGVGLHICQQLLQEHGGRMGFESAEGKGSTFFFCLPCHRSSPVETP